MNAKPALPAQEKLEELLKVYQPFDVSSLMTIFAICWDLGVEERLIDLSQLSFEQIEECQQKICNKYTHNDSEFLEEELETRYLQEREQSTSLESLYEWCY